MEKFSEYLRAQREERKIRLSDVAVQTRISLKFLEAIEDGNFEILPETYIRAFIRDYAKAIGLDPDETVGLFNQHVEALKAAAEQVVISDTDKASPTPISLTNAQKIFAGIIGLGILIGLSYLAFSPSKKQPVDVNAYESMEEVNQKKFDSAYTAATTTKPIVKGDSARLVLSATDTVWVNLVIDEGKTYDLLMRPGNRFAFWGRRKFNMTIGNAGGLVLSLNGHEIPPLGKPGIVIRNVTILKDGSIKK
ncbi:MAG TPA: helix-turn-helix domain-containing protein [Candidatus Acidoferrales bacterium]|nr:helix-turn-helix domain-containing protein [Candidatus Acidoferrales bacterium]